MNKLDEQDQQILAQRLAAWNAKDGPRVGDYVLRADGKAARFSHDWAGWEDDGLQSSVGGSFYFGDGYMSFSGGLDPSIPRASLESTGETRLGVCWFFHHDYHTAHNGVYFEVPCRVFREVQK